MYTARRMNLPFGLALTVLALGCGHQSAEPPPSTLPARLMSAEPGCLDTLRMWRVPFVVPVGRVRGIANPVEITGPIGEVRLVPRVGRPALMDCELARALAESGPLFRRLGITGLSFSEGYDYRVRRGSRELSAHAFGLAIDVHAIETRTGRWEVADSFAKDPERWHALTDAGEPPPLRACIGRPATPQGRLLRQLACGLRSEPSVRLVLSPDDNHDHHDHLHIETYPADGEPLYAHAPSRPLRQGRRVAR
jgi:hypothetical protein